MDNNEILDAIEIIVNKRLKNTAQIHLAVVTAVSDTGKKVTITNNGVTSTIRYYGSTPVVNMSYPIFVPNGDMSLAFMISG